MNFNGFTPVQLNRLGLKLKPIFIGKLITTSTLNYPAYTYRDNHFEQVIKKDSGISNEVIRKYAQEYGTEIFVHKEDYENINLKIKSELTKLTRSLSVGDIHKNAIKHTNLLSMQMDNLYKDPFNDELLTGQYQNSKNLGTLLLNEYEVTKSVFHHIRKSHYHYTLTQPLLSSLLLLSFLKSLKIFDPKEIEGLFLTSYFKDIGMSFIPREKFELSHLNDFDKNLFSNHANNSMQILEGRVPFNETQLNLIKNHHFLNYKIQSVVNKNVSSFDSGMLTGVESILLSSVDILIAMTSDRPYRRALSNYKALELLKTVVSDLYPHEYRALVMFVKNFNSK